MFSTLKKWFIGRPLKSGAEGEGGLLGKMQALAMLSSDALSSIAYGPEQVILVLMTVSAGAIWWSIPIGIVVLVLLASLTISYRQVIHAYPQGGGAYMVTTENLSPKAGLIAGGSLLVDYMLTVAVSVSSGADAITSAIPSLHPYNLHISILLVLILMLMNLRGLRESATSLMIPVYLFIVSTIALIGYGVIQILTGHLAYNATAHVGQTISGVSVILLLRAFTSGSASLTGVEAISNSVPFFKKPKANNAASTLTIMALILGIMFAGITFLNYWVGVVPAKGVTTLAQMAQAILGNSPVGQAFFYVFQLSTALILAVAANTGFSAFPVLSYNMAKNKYMPHMYMEKGDFDKAVKKWALALECAPCADTWNEIGMSSMETGHIQYAQTAFEQVKKLEPDFENINEKLTALYLLLDDMENFLKYNQLCAHPFQAKDLENMLDLLDCKNRDEMIKRVKEIFGGSGLF